MRYLASLPVFLTYFSLATMLLVVFGAVYHRITPWSEIRMIREGNCAAAISYGGALVGYAIVLASVMASSVNRADFLLWSVVGFLVQVAAFYVARFLMGSDYRDKMLAGQTSTGIFLASVSLSASILNAATMAG
jgi:putative membrane protein